MNIEQKRQLAIERLQATIDKIKTLQPEQFNYKNYVTKHENGCGTTCCVAGWYPLWFTDTKLVWNNDGVLKTTNQKCVKGNLQDYHLLNYKAIDALFYGLSYFPFIPFVPISKMDEKTPLEIHDRFVKVMEILKDDNFYTEVLDKDLC